MPRQENNSIVICDIYAAIAGEGRIAGQPVTAIRLFGTNFKDRYDLHMYASEASVKNGTSRREILLEDALAEMSRTKSQKDHWLVMGGEPMLQQQSVVALAKKYAESHNVSPTIDWETNGQIYPSEATREASNSFAVNIKLANSLGSKSAKDGFSMRIKEDVLRKFVNDEKAYFKFGLTSVDDFREARELIDFLKISADRVWLMPNVMDANRLRAIGPSIANLCKASGYNYSPRLQLEVFNGKRGF